jgi:hypothetical protein
MTIKSGALSEFAEIRMRGPIYDKFGVEIGGGGGSTDPNAWHKGGDAFGAGAVVANTTGDLLVGDAGQKTDIVGTECNVEVSGEFNVNDSVTNLFSVDSGRTLLLTDEIQLAGSDISLNIIPNQITPDVVYVDVANGMKLSYGSLTPNMSILKYTISATNPPPAGQMYYYFQAQAEYNINHFVFNEVDGDGVNRSALFASIMSQPFRNFQLLMTFPDTHIVSETTEIVSSTYTPPVINIACPTYFTSLSGFTAGLVLQVEMSAITSYSEGLNSAVRPSVSNRWRYIGVSTTPAKGEFSTNAGRFYYHKYDSSGRDNTQNFNFLNAQLQSGIQMIFLLLDVAGGQLITNDTSVTQAGDVYSFTGNSPIIFVVGDYYTHDQQIVNPATQWQTGVTNQFGVGSTLVNNADVTLGSTDPSDGTIAFKINNRDSVYLTGAGDNVILTAHAEDASFTIQTIDGQSGGASGELLIRTGGNTGSPPSGALQIYTGNTTNSTGNLDIFTGSSNGAFGGGGSIGSVSISAGTGTGPNLINGGNVVITASDGINGGVDGVVQLNTSSGTGITIDKSKMFTTIAGYTANITQNEDIVNKEYVDNAVNASLVNGGNMATSITVGARQAPTDAWNNLINYIGVNDRILYRLKHYINSADPIQQQVWFEIPNDTYQFIYNAGEQTDPARNGCQFSFTAGNINQNPTTAKGGKISFTGGAWYGGAQAGLADYSKWGDIDIAVGNPGLNGRTIRLNAQRGGGILEVVNGQGIGGWFSIPYENNCNQPNDIPNNAYLSSVYATQSSVSNMIKNDYTNPALDFGSSVGPVEIHTNDDGYLLLSNLTTAFALSAENPRVELRTAGGQFDITDTPNGQLFSLSSTLNRLDINTTTTRIPNLATSTADHVMFRASVGGALSSSPAPAGDLVGTTESQVLTSKTLDDASCRIRNTTDTTKQLRFNLFGVAPSTTRVAYYPDRTGSFLINGVIGNIPMNITATPTIGDRLEFNGTDWVASPSPLFSSILFVNYTTPTSIATTTLNSYVIVAPTTTLNSIINGSFDMPSNGRIRFTGTGTYNCVVMVELVGNFTTNARASGLRIYRDGVPQTNSEVRDAYDNAGLYQTIQTRYISTCTTNTYFELYMARRMV